jgi:23S rRNA (cytosine1962-C5)-methyltransferase
LLINQDASFYLDTRNLRLWAKTHLTEKSVLNTFAYTGSYGVAASAGGARRAVHIDLNRRFLNLAKSSYALNGIPILRANFMQGDFWILTNRLKRADELFDCVFLDPPFFSSTQGGIVNLLQHNTRVINKVRPLIKDGGQLVTINNALFVSGADYLQTLEILCTDGYLSIESFIPVPPDISGYSHTRIRELPVDPSPFNHSTKIAVLRVRRKDRR